MRWRPILVALALGVATWLLAIGAAYLLVWGVGRACGLAPAAIGVELVC